MRIATSMRAASGAAAASAPSLMSPSPARTVSFSVMTATAQPSLHSALPVGRLSCLVCPRASSWVWDLSSEKGLCVCPSHTCMRFGVGRDLGILQVPGTCTDLLCMYAL